MPLSESNLESDKKIRTRRVHYISGFDPRGAAYYHRLFREEACKQGCLNKAQIHVGSRSRLNANVTRWEVSSKWDGELVHTDYQFMHWDDFVRRHWGLFPEPAKWGRAILAAADPYKRAVVAWLGREFAEANFRAGPVCKRLLEQMSHLLEGMGEKGNPRKP